MEERGKVALITGASQGLGACMARRIAEKGYLAVVNYAHSRERAEKVATEIRGDGNDAVAIRCDISEEDAVKALFAELEEKFGGVDVLVNNARVDPLSRRPEESDGMWWDRVMAVGRAAHISAAMNSPGMPAATGTGGSSMFQAAAPIAPMSLNQSPIQPASWRCTA